MNVVLQAVLHTVQEQPLLFSSQTLRAMYGASLAAVARTRPWSCLVVKAASF